MALSLGIDGMQQFCHSYLYSSLVLSVDCLSVLQASSNDLAALEFLQPRGLDLDALQRPLPKGSAEAAAQVCLMALPAWLHFVLLSCKKSWAAHLILTRHACPEFLTSLSRFAKHLTLNIGSLVQWVLRVSADMMPTSAQLNSRNSFTWFAQ